MRHLKTLDYLIFLLALSAVAASAAWSSSDRSGEAMVEVEAAGQKYVLPLSVDTDLVLEGPVGKTVLEIHDGVAAVTHSDCRDNICVAAGGISHSSEWIACLPNRVFIRITGGKSSEGGADAVAF